MPYRSELDALRERANRARFALSELDAERGVRARASSQRSNSSSTRDLPH